ncbi:MAG: protein kinase, partial [Ktedonobacteraceae bacterium]|nr:protein kinase [Ktedonobacteraceae bacterium]
MKRAEQHLGHYHLLRLLGHGSFADVYLGEHIHLKSVAAIKMLSTHLLKEQRENFLHEARVLAQLSHPHIIRILDFGIEEDIPYLVMDYASEGSLSQRHPRNTML